MHRYMHMDMNVCIYVILMHRYMCVDMYVYISYSNAWVHVFGCVCAYICMCICICVYIFVYIYMKSVCVFTYWIVLPPRYPDAWIYLY